MSDSKYELKGLTKLSKNLHKFQMDAGFTDSSVTQRLMLVHSEISEAFDAFRNDHYADLIPFLNDTLYHVVCDIPCCEENNSQYKALFEKLVKDSFEDEITDAIIRLLAICGENDIDIEKHLNAKMKYNSLRGYKYGGKKF